MVPRLIGTFSHPLSSPFVPNCMDTLDPQMLTIQNYRGPAPSLSRGRVDNKQLRKPSSSLYRMEEGTPRSGKTLAENLP